jgi:hypothetical protein
MTSVSHVVLATALVWGVASRLRMLTRENGTFDVWSLDFSPGGSRLADASVSGEILVLDTIPLRQRIKP